MYTRLYNAFFVDMFAFVDNQERQPEKTLRYQ